MAPSWDLLNKSEGGEAHRGKVTSFTARDMKVAFSSGVKPPFPLVI